MGNYLPEKIKTWTIWELFAQMKLLEYGVQAAPPIKDSGNDLIWINWEVVKFIQIKTATNRMPSANRRDLPLIYHLLFLIRLHKENGEINYEKSKIKILVHDRGELYEVWLLDKNRIESIWGR